MMKDKEVLLVHCNIANNDYEQDSRVSYTFFPNKPFGNLLKISQKSHIFLKTFNFQNLKPLKCGSQIKNSQTLQIEDKINLTLVIKLYSHYKNE